MILVTGGAGFIGNAILAALEARDQRDVIVSDDLGSSEKWCNLRERQFATYVPRGELLQRLEAAPSALAESLHAVIHMGACSATDASDMDDLWRWNVDFTLRLYSCCARRAIPFLYASSAATYGAGEHGYRDEPELTAKLRPLNRYGLSKLWVDRALSAGSRPQEPAPPFWCGLRFFNVYGPGEAYKGLMQSLVAKAYPEIQQRGRLTLFRSHRPDIADGAQSRDFVYIKDVAEIVVALLDGALSGRYGASHSGVYNLGSGTARTFQALGEAVFAALGRPASFDWIDTPSHLRSGYQYFTEASLHRLRSILELGHTFTRLEDGVADYVQNYLVPGRRAL